MTEAGEPLNNPHNIRIQTERMGRDYLFMITGGVEHIGAAATAYWTGDEVMSTVSAVPGHKEDQLSLECAELACRRLRRTVTVAAGIHIDNATREQIGEIVHTIRLLMSRQVDRLAQEAGEEPADDASRH